jgi:hypothetical protein
MDAKIVPLENTAQVLLCVLSQMVALTVTLEKLAWLAQQHVLNVIPVIIPLPQPLTCVRLVN